MANEIARRPQMAASMRVVQRLGGMLSAAFLFAASNSAFACHQTGHAERCITGYSPSTVSSDAAATVIVGRRFGSDLHRTGWQVMYGTGADALGRATVRSWAPASIQVQLPTGLAAGSYWLALYNADGQLRSNRLAGLTVRSFTLSPAQPGIVAPAPGPFAPEFFDVAVTLTRLVARESGDSASDGDWIVNFAAHPTGEFPHWVRWPGHSGSQNVGDGSSLGPVGPIRLRVRSDQDIEGFLHILDCDADLIVVHIVAELFADCNGEELYDLVSGAPDAASTRFRLIPAQWQRGAEVRRTESQEGIEYTAHFRVDATPAAP